MLPNPKLGHAIIPHGGEEEGKPLHSLRVLCRHRLEGEGNIHRNSLPPIGKGFTFLLRPVM